ncbi:hypothetical protein JXA40_00775 [bacterium]|nr:hypothetical protein [candidate division CSSED10-310 bacterium]
MISTGKYSEFRCLIRMDLHRFKNAITRNSPAVLVKWVLVFSIAVVFIYSEFFLARTLFIHILKQVYLEELRYILLAKLLNMVVLVFAVLLFYSSIIMAISSYFLSAEIDLIHTKPVASASLFAYRMLETLIRSSWMFIAFGTPIFWAYGDALAHGFPFKWLTVADVISVAIIAASLGIMIANTLILFFSPRRAQKALLLVGIAVSVGMVLIFRWMRPEQMIDPIGAEQLTFYIDAMRFPTIVWMPTTWASEALATYTEGAMIRSARYIGMLWSSALIATVSSYWLFRLIWFRARSGGRGSERIKNRRVKRLSENRFAAVRMGFFIRDIKLFMRDASQWSQIIVIAALIAIYIFNFKNLPYELYGFQYSMSHISVAASGLILSALLARFAFPAVSVEGRAVWLLQSAPIDWNRYLWFKFAFHFLPALTVGLLLVGFSIVVLDVPKELMQRCLAAIGLITFGCTGLAVGLGSIRPRYDMEDPARVAVSSGGLVFMLLSISFIIVMVALSVLPDVIRFFSLYWRIFRYWKHLDRGLTWSIMVCITCLTVMLPMRIGIHALKRRS